MTPEEAARATAPAIGALSATYMLDMDTYAHGAELGFEGLAFYLAGRGGVLGEVPAEVVTAALAFWAPATVKQGWESGCRTMPPAEAAARWAEAGHAWAREHLADREGCGRLAELAGRVAEAASPAGAPIFAGWRLIPVPDDPPAACLHQMNVLRELRMSLHVGAVLAAGLTPLEAVAVNAPGMAGIYGWGDDLPDAEPLRPVWQEAEVATNRAMARVLQVLDDAERAELVERCAEVSG